MQPVTATMVEVSVLDLAGDDVSSSFFKRNFFFKISHLLQFSLSPVLPPPPCYEALLPPSFLPFFSYLLENFLPLVNIWEKLSHFKDDIS